MAVIEVCTSSHAESSKNSTSLTRGVRARNEGFKGTSLNLPFWPGGFETDFEKQLDQSAIDSKLFGCANIYILRSCMGMNVFVKTLDLLEATPAIPDVDLCSDSKRDMVDDTVTNFPHRMLNSNRNSLNPPNETKSLDLSTALLPDIFDLTGVSLVPKCLDLRAGKMLAV